MNAYSKRTVSTSHAIMAMQENSFGTFISLNNCKACVIEPDLENLKTREFSTYVLSSIFGHKTELLYHVSCKLPQALAPAKVKWVGLIPSEFISEQVLSLLIESILN
ncbi:hypothetical protein AMTR_s00265p00015680 [Amborella trichopoda]|uniref:Uncharacterized protein n=1 Tax=Amborella trichopoda TaxID=13333 RepID=W1NFA9_AMBTC|nr:hypothetical protein AMTR_s00265p00015680 [Amborella trichopoda]